MADIVLTALNAKYPHCALGLRYLQANLGELQPRSILREFDISQRPLEIAEALLAAEPRIIALGVYLWNLGLATELVRLLKLLRPEVALIVGGPEVSYATELPALTDLVDVTIAGEADLQFAEVCRRLLNGQRPATRFLPPTPPILADVRLPYLLYTDQDIQHHRIIYVETSRGCPMGCEFCLSAIEASVRLFPLENVLDQIAHLLARGCRHFKFADRSLNLVPAHYDQVLRFFLARPEPDLGVHMEIVPDRLSQAQLELAQRFAPGVLQFEMGIQTFNPKVAERIHRHQNLDRIVEVIRWLRTQTAVHLHADLIAGLPGESLDSLGDGFDRLVALGPQEIQLGVLKRLRGSLIQRHDQEWQMAFNPEAPYDLVQNRLIDFATMQRLKRMARYWDLVANNGNFLTSYPLIWHDQPSPFGAFLAFSDWLFQQTKRQHGIALHRLAEGLWLYLTEGLKLPPDLVGSHLAQDYHHCGRSDPPPFLKAWARSDRRVPEPGLSALKRQRRHRDQRLPDANP